MAEKLRNFWDRFQGTKGTFPTENKKFEYFLDIGYENHQIGPIIKKLLRIFETSTWLIFKRVVPSNFPQRMWILDIMMGDTLLFTGTKTTKHFSRYGPFFALTLKIDFPKISACLEKTLFA